MIVESQLSRQSLRMSVVFWCPKHFTLQIRELRACGFPIPVVASPKGQPCPLPRHLERHYHMHSSQRRAGYLTLLLCDDTAKETSAAGVCYCSMHVWTQLVRMWLEDQDWGLPWWLITDTHATTTSQWEQHTTFDAHDLLNAKACST